MGQPANPPEHIDDIFDLHMDDLENGRFAEDSSAPLGQDPQSDIVMAAHDYLHEDPADPLWSLYTFRG